MLPPVLIVQIPLNGLLNTCIEVVFWLPAQFRLQLGGIDSVTAVMAWAILYKTDQRFSLFKIMK